ncbi:MAG: 3-dehydroquinate synthase [Omnitrophica WOR_2 bacterium RBG_13_41_10]|nr:MAG: 3-dehydroquinate synthase [Omnitrophica WOR_2 bacterium RBG_13_41_10]
MPVIKVNLKKRSYNIMVGAGILSSLGKYLQKLGIGNSAYIITNNPVNNKYGVKLNQALKKYGFTTRFKIVPDSEKSKALEIAAAVIKDLASYDRNRRIFIIAFGGGVIGDLASFIASIYKRGIPCVQIPTTLLAQVDSAIGGKTAVDLAQGKNLVGTFYQPRLVLSDVSILKTLPLRQLKTGLAEVIKYGIIQDPYLFSYLEKKYKDLLNLKTASLEFIVSRCSAIKAGIVGRDEKEEKGIRTILNFGHTIGHAVEAAGGYNKYNHGEAIALGMLAATGISNRLGLLKNKDALRIANLIKKIGLPTKIQGVAYQKIISAHYRDKKFIGIKNRFVLIKGIAKTKIVENIPLEIIKEALRKT